MDHQKSTIRAFFAIPIPEQLRNNLSTTTNTLKFGNWFPSAKWVRSDQLHITLKFLPEVERINIEKIKQTMNSWSTLVEPFDISTISLGAFPTKAKPRVIMIDVKSHSYYLQKLTDLIESDMEKLHYTREKRITKTHITLARIKRDTSFHWPSTDFIVKLFDILPSFSVKYLQFFESQLSSQGAQYRLIHEINW